MVSPYPVIRISYKNASWFTKWLQVIGRIWVTIFTTFCLLLNVVLSFLCTIGCIANQYSKTALSIFFFALKTTNNNGKLFLQRAKSKRCWAREVHPISNTLATLTLPWWPELVLTTRLGFKYYCDSQMAAGIMKQGGMPSQGWVL